VLVCTQTSRSPQPSAAAAQVAESLARALQRRVWVAARSGVDLAAFDETGEVPFRHGRRRDEKPLPPPLPLRLDEGPPESFLG
jgi:hypothetical protein